MEEIWKDIVGYEGLYQISNLGRIKSLSRFCKYSSGKTRKVNERIMKFDISKLGYFRVHLSKNGIDKKILVHRLVAQAFIPNPKNYPIINHKDENPSNNKVNNLEWCNVEYNNTYGNKIKKLYKEIIQLNKNGEIIKCYPNTVQASKETGIVRCTITNCLNGRTKTAGGYIWKFKK